MFQSLKLNLGTRKSEKGQMKKERAVALGLGFDAWNWQLISVTFGSAATKRYFWDLTGTLPKKKKKKTQLPRCRTAEFLRTILKKNFFFLPTQRNRQRRKEFHGITLFLFGPGESWGWS